MTTPPAQKPQMSSLAALRHCRHQRAGASPESFSYLPRKVFPIQSHCVKVRRANQSAHQQRNSLQVGTAVASAAWLGSVNPPQAGELLSPFYFYPRGGAEVALKSGCPCGNSRHSATERLMPPFILNKAALTITRDGGAARLSDTTVRWPCKGQAWLLSLRGRLRTALPPQGKSPP